MSMENEPGKIIIIDEKIYQCVARDCVTMTALLFAFWANYRFIGNGVVLQLILAVLFFLWMGSRSKKLVKRMGPEEALEYLSEKYGGAKCQNTTTR